MIEFYLSRLNKQNSGLRACLNKITLTLFCLIFILLSNGINAHEISTAHLKITQISDAQHQGYVRYSLEDLEQVVGLDSNNDGQLNWGELRQSLHKVQNYISDNLEITDGELCLIDWEKNISIGDSYAEKVLNLPFLMDCNLASHDSANGDSANGDLSSRDVSNHDSDTQKTIIYNGFFDALEEHKLLVIWQTTGGVQNTILSDQVTQWSLQDKNTTALDNFIFYWQQGVIHIWIGLDHILFILALVLPIAGYQRVNRRTENTKNHATSLSVFKQILWLITGFTIAHSITLTMTAMDMKFLPGKWVEAGIAASVVFAGINVYTGWIKKLGILTVSFGLLHGMGFAGALSELGIPDNYQLSSILAFNLGVEVGQLAILAVAFPLLWKLRSFTTARNFIIPFSAFSLSVVGIFWLLQRLGMV